MTREELIEVMADAIRDNLIGEHDAHYCATAALAAIEAAGVRLVPVEELEDLLAGPAAWLDGWAEHVGTCWGGDQCACGLTLARHELAGAREALAAVNALPELLERVRRLEEALKFYADPNRWPNMPNPKNPHYDLEMDAGSRARFALHARAALNQEPGQ